MELDIAATASNADAIEAEQELVERARTDREAFGQLYRLHCRAITGYVRRRVGDPHATEDLVSEVFMDVLRALPRYRYRGLPVRAWLYRIATNRVNRWARGMRRRAIKQLSADIEDHRQTASSRDRVESARACLLSLPLKYQTVLALHYLEGMSVAEIAGTIGCREGTVKSRLSRGRDAMRKRLQRGRTSR